MFELSDVKFRWLLFTVLYGVVPILLRLLMSFFIDEGEGMARFTASDFIAFGIVLQVSIFNEMRYHDASDLEWKHRMTGVSAFLMLFYVGLYMLMLFSEIYHKLKVDSLLTCSMVSAAVSLLLCYVFYDRMSLAPKKKVEGI